MNDKQAEKDRFEFESMECYLTKVKYFGRHRKSDGIDDSYCQDKYRVIMFSSVLDNLNDEVKNAMSRVNYGKATYILSIVPPGTLLPQPPIDVRYYLIIDAFETRQEAENLIGYLKTNFVRQIVSQYDFKNGLCNAVFMHVPVLDFNEVWDDARLEEELGQVPNR